MRVCVWGFDSHAGTSVNFVYEFDGEKKDKKKGPTPQTVNSDVSGRPVLSQTVSRINSKMHHQNAVKSKLFCKFPMSARTSAISECFFLNNL